MVDQPADPPCAGCEDPCHCPVHGVHHVVPNMVTWCIEREGR